MYKFLIRKDGDSLTKMKARLASPSSQLAHFCHNTHAFRYNGRGYRGATRLLKNKFYGHDGHFKKRRSGCSNRVQGDTLHRHVFHKYICKNKNKNKCECKTKFGKRTCAPRKNSKTSKMLEAFQQFLTDKKWKVLDCELPVIWHRVNAATSLDVVCADEDTKQTIVVELKTGYSKNVVTRKVGKTKKMLDGKLTNTPLHQHQLQLWFGVEALKSCYGIKCDKACVLYLDADAKYREEVAHEWWWRDGKRKEELTKKLKN